MKEPRILYRYIAGEFMKAFIFSIITITLVMLISELFDDIHILFDYHASLLTILYYFACRFPLTALKFCPMATLLATLFTLNTFTKYNEVMAMKTNGLNLIRITGPIIVMSVLISVSVIAVHELFAAELYYHSKVLKYNEILKTGFNDSDIRDNIAFKSLEGWFGYIKHFNSEQGQMSEVTLTFADNAGFIFKRIDASSAAWNGKNWIFKDCTIREFAKTNAGEQSEKVSKYTSIPLLIKETPKDLAKSKKMNEESTLRESKETIAKLKASGAKYKDELFFFHSKISVAFANLIMALIGIPFGVVAGKYGGIIFSLILSLVLGLAYNNLIFIGQLFCSTGVISPFLAAWAGNLLFSIVGFAMIFKVRK